MGRKSKEELKQIEETILNKTNKKVKEIKNNYFPTGCDLLDLVVGGGILKGYGVGKIINIVGDKSTFKTFLACELLAASKNKYKDKLKWIYDDCESGFTFDDQIYGFEIMPKEQKVRSNTVEEAYCNIRTFLEALKKEEYGIYIIDSLDGLDSIEGNEIANERYKAFQKGKEFDKGSYRTGKPKYLSQEFFPNIANLLESKNATLIIISQVRENINPMSFEKYIRSGGKALDFYAHSVIWLANAKKLKVKDRTIGATIKAKTTKSKTPRPYRECFINILFDYGVDNIATNVNFLYDALTPTGQASLSTKCVWDEKEYKLKDMIQYIQDNSLEKELKIKVKQKWEEIEQSIRTKRPPKYVNN